jgi:hypothetical protein
VFGYHCDHTRVAAANNKGRATKMNDMDRFIWNVSTPYVPAQAETWGWPEFEIEEIRLDRETAYERFVAGVGRVVDPAPVPYSTSSVEWHLYEDLTYDLAHTLPFVCDQVLTYPRHTSLLVVPARTDFIRGFAEAWRGMGFTGPVVVPTECDWITGEIEGVTRQTFDEALADADLFLFEFGLTTQRPFEPVRVGRTRTVRDNEVLKRVRKIFQRAANLEGETRPRRRRLPRRFIGVNVIYNRNWRLFTDYIAANIHPFCAQVLAGPVRNKSKLGRTLTNLRTRFEPA